LRGRLRGVPGTTTAADLEAYRQFMNPPPRVFRTEEGERTVVTPGEKARATDADIYRMTHGENFPGPVSPAEAARERIAEYEGSRQPQKVAEATDGLKGIPKTAGAPRKGETKSPLRKKVDSKYLSRVSQAVIYKGPGLMRSEEDVQNIEKTVQGLEPLRTDYEQMNEDQQAAFRAMLAEAAPKIFGDDPDWVGGTTGMGRGDPIAVNVNNRIAEAREMFGLPSVIPEVNPLADTAAAVINPLAAAAKLGNLVWDDLRSRLR